MPERLAQFRRLRCRWDCRHSETAPIEASARGPSADLIRIASCNRHRALTVGRSSSPPSRRRPRCEGKRSGLLRQAVVVPIIARACGACDRTSPAGPGIRQVVGTSAPAPLLGCFFRAWQCGRQHAKFHETRRRLYLTSPRSIHAPAAWALGPRLGSPAPSDLQRVRYTNGALGRALRC